MCTKRIMIFGATVVFASPTLIFMAVALADGMTQAATLDAVREQYTADRLNLLVVSLLGLVPVVLLTAILLARRLLRRPVGNNAAFALGGMLPIVAVTIFVSLEFWPVFLPERVYPGFPHGLEFIIGPGIFAPAGMVAGMLVAWAVLRRRA